MNKWRIYTAVFIGGAAVLAIEILGTCILGPFYGVSLFLWSALITVTLVALSVGYAIGGCWADKGATLPRLHYLLAGAGIWTLTELQGSAAPLPAPYGHGKRSRMDPPNGGNPPAPRALSLRSSVQGGVPWSPERYFPS